MESGGIPGKVNVSRKTYERVYKKYDFEDEREIEVLFVFFQSLKVEHLSLLCTCLLSVHVPSL